MTDIVQTASELVPELSDAVSSGVHLFWETPFSDYTVSEGLLLLLLLVGFLWLIISFFRGGY